jgi:hypothetical protein
MRPTLPNLPQPQLPESTTWGLAFQAVNSVALAVVSSKILLDMVCERRETRHKPQPVDENLGPLVRREVQRALAAQDERRGRRA